MTSPLLDTFGRRHNNLRISVTDRCNLRCTYCMPEDVTFLDRAELLTFEEIERFVRAVAPLGIDKIRLTGGEPLMRKNLSALVRMLQAVPGIRDLAVTTNALLLADQADALFDSGLRRLNISLDTLDTDRFQQLTRRDGLMATLRGIERAKERGFGPIKINAVAVRGFIEYDAVPLAKYCREHGFELRFIEYMPIGAEAWQRAKCVPAYELIEWIEAGVGPLNPARDFDPAAPAMEFEYADGGGKLGIIASVSKPFCRSCNRIRLTADGKLRNCLFALDEVDVKSILRQPQFDPEQLRDAVRANVMEKWEGHEINSAKFVKPLRTMHAIGG
jgi:cyclic pyranopterin phosphate synthase